MRLSTYLLPLLIAASFLTACGSVSSNGATELDAAVDEAEQEALENNWVILAGGLVDTLSGEAQFGRVLSPKERSERLVIKMNVGSDFVGGLFITMPDTSLPSAGEYDVIPASAADSVQGFTVLYREGLVRRLGAASGTVTLETANDTLLAGTFQLTMEGLVAPTGGELLESEVHARGEFRASKGYVGFVVGL